MTYCCKVTLIPSPFKKQQQEQNLLSVKQMQLLPEEFTQLKYLVAACTKFHSTGQVLDTE